jgi:hypothetical protein
MMWGYQWGWGAWLTMGVMMVVFWVLAIAGIVLLVRYLGSRQGEAAADGAAAVPRSSWPSGSLAARSIRTSTPGGARCCGPADEYGAPTQPAAAGGLALAALVLEVASTVGLAAASGTLGGRATVRCAAPRLPGAVVDVALADAGGMMAAR